MKCIKIQDKGWENGLPKTDPIVNQKNQSVTKKVALCKYTIPKQEEEKR